MPSRLFALIALFCLPSTLLAQSQAPVRYVTEATAHYQIFGGYSYLSNTINGLPGSRQALNGWDASVAFASWRGLRFKLDTSGYIGTNLSAPQHIVFVLGGAQYSRAIRRETVFVEGLAGDGGANSNWGPNAVSGQTTAFTGLAGGGLDTPLTRRIAFRVSGDFQYSYFALNNTRNIVPYRPAGLPTNFGRLSSGLVWIF